MSIIIVHDPLTSKLAAADTAVELCAPDGRVLGYFTPAKEKKLNLEPPGTAEELAARFATGGGRPLVEILRDLEKRS